MRITAKELQDDVDRLNKIHNLDLSLEYAYGQPRLFSNDGRIELSPRLPKRQMRDWLDAFGKGAESQRGAHE